MATIDDLTLRIQKLRRDETIAGFPKFEDAKISTRTIMIYFGHEIDPKKLFENVPISPYWIEKKTRGRKPKGYVPPERQENNMKVGDVIHVRYHNKTRHMYTGAIPRNILKGTYLPNQTSMKIYVGNNTFIDIKGFTNGKFEITGCAKDEYLKTGLEYLSKYLIETGSINMKTLDFRTRIVMENRGFSLGFRIDRYALVSAIAKEVAESHFEAMYTPGANIKLVVPVENTMEKKFRFENGKIEYIGIEETGAQSVKSTFNIFSTGSVIQSCVRDTGGKEAYEKLIHLIAKYRSQIEDVV